MEFYFYLFLNLSIFLPGIVAFFRFRIIEKSYYPFIYCLWLGCLNEAISTWLVFNDYQTLINNNIYVLAESILLLTYFSFSTTFISRKLYYALIGSFIAIWIGENFVFGTILKNSTYFRIFSSFIIVLLSINIINQKIFTKKTSLLADPEFIICCGFIIYFTYKVIVQAFAIYGFSKQSAFLLNIYIIMYYINFIVNIIYTIAIVWMRRKTKYSLQSLLQSS